ncbi:MAG: UDP-3-O-(3-hydroxymyristoyl)glucosamine N-acyltransferase [Helicobacteraceae bacterium]|jgi:UDP-3-O-[3-hydroxymyristoyl] glucosamine N-acyltransferase|nr:UDP-3-O-(3-hydroxymyristoyl)glucosamine N-acyltransferase [Helicobacteraceae bacterium]
MRVTEILLGLESEFGGGVIGEIIDRAVVNREGLKRDILEMDIVGIESLKTAGAEHLSFLANERHVDELKTTKAAAVFVTKEQASLVPAETAAIVCADPYRAFAKSTAFFTRPLAKSEGKKPRIGEGAKIAPNARVGLDSVIGANCLIMDGAYIGDDCEIGDDCVIYPNAVIYNRTKIGDHCRIHAGTVIGSDGFGYARGEKGEHLKIRHLGRVVVEDFVEIGANCAIDRAALGETRIKSGAKIDNLVHIAHGCEIGERSLITAQTGFAGGVKTGKYFVTGGQSAITGHIEICDNVMIAGKAGVTKSIKKSGTYAGFPAIKHREWLRLNSFIMRQFKKSLDEAE